MSKKKEKPTLSKRELLYEHAGMVIFHFLNIIDYIAETIEPEGAENEDRRYPES